MLAIEIEGLSTCFTILLTSSTMPQSDKLVLMKNSQDPEHLFRSIIQLQAPCFQAQQAPARTSTSLTTTMTSLTTQATCYLTRRLDQGIYHIYRRRQRIKRSWLLRVLTGCSPLSMRRLNKRGQSDRSV